MLISTNSTARAKKSPRDIRLPRAPAEKFRSKSGRRQNSKTEAILASPPDQQAQDAVSTDTARERTDDVPSDSTAVNDSPASVATSISSSSASIASSETSDDSNTTHTPNTGLGSRDSSSNLTNSLGLGLSGYDDTDRSHGYTPEALSRVMRRKAFAYEAADEDPAEGTVSREQTPRSYAPAPSLRSVDDQAFLVPSSLGSSTSTSPAREMGDPAGEAVLRPRPAPPRDVTEGEIKDDVPDIDGMASIGTLMLGAPVQT